MSFDKLARRLDAIAADLARLGSQRSPCPDDQLAWMHWLSNDDLAWVEALTYRWEYEDQEPTLSEQARWLALEADAIQRMLNGEPGAVEGR